MSFIYIFKEICYIHLRKHYPLLSSPNCTVEKSSRPDLCTVIKYKESAQKYRYMTQELKLNKKRKRMKNDFQKKEQLGTNKIPLCSKS